MSLELRSTSRKFYSRLTVNGKRKVLALQTYYAGIPPEGLKLRLEGDAEFERSRGRALEEEKALRAAFEKADSEETLQKRVYQAATSKKFKPTTVAELFGISKAHQRSKPWSSEWESQVASRHAKLIEFLKKHHPKLEFAHEVTRSIAEQFLRNYHEATKCSAKTLNDVKFAMQGLWTVAWKLELLADNPFRKIEKRKHISISKKPFSAAELDAILNEATKDPDLYAMCVLAASTGMRLVDCCLLEWSSIDMDSCMVEVPSQKKNQNPTHIPYFGALETLINEAWRSRDDQTFVFPRARYLYELNREHFTKAFSMLLLRLGYTDDENAKSTIRVTPSGGGSRRVPLRSFHGLRTTWMTHALNGGISMQDVQRIIGSADSETIMKHYFNSNGERIRKLLQKNMPLCLGGLSHADGTDGLNFTVARMMSDLEPSEKGKLARQLIAQIEQYLPSPGQCASGN